MIGSGGLFNDADGALDQLFVLGPDINHEVAVNVAQARQGSGGNHIQNHFVSGARFHAGGAGENLGADFGDDSEIGGAFERGVAVAGEGDGAGSAGAGVVDGSDGEGGAAAGGDAENDIALPGLELFHFGDGQGGVVFAGFGGGAEGFGTSGHDELHGAWIGVEGGLDFGGVESAEASAGAGADVDEASAVAEAGDDEVDGAGDLREGAAHGGGDGCVFAVDEANDFERRHAIKISRRGENLFGG